MHGVPFAVRHIHELNVSVYCLINFSDAELMQ